LLMRRFNSLFYYKKKPYILKNNYYKQNSSSLRFALFLKFIKKKKNYNFFLKKNFIFNKPFRAKLRFFWKKNFIILLYLNRYGFTRLTYIFNWLVFYNYWFLFSLFLGFLTINQFKNTKKFKNNVLCFFNLKTTQQPPHERFKTLCLTPHKLNCEKTRQKIYIYYSVYKTNQRFYLEKKTTRVINKTRFYYFLKTTYCFKLNKKPFLTKPVTKPNRKPRLKGYLRNLKPFFIVQKKLLPFRFVINHRLKRKRFRFNLHIKRFRRFIFFKIRMKTFTKRTGLGLFLHRKQGRFMVFYKKTWLNFLLHSLSFCLFILKSKTVLLFFTWFKFFTFIQTLLQKTNVKGNLLLQKYKKKKKPFFLRYKNRFQRRRWFLNKKKKVFFNKHGVLFFKKRLFLINLKKIKYFFNRKRIWKKRIFKNPLKLMFRKKTIIRVHKPRRFFILFKRFNKLTKTNNYIFKLKTSFIYDRYRFFLNQYFSKDNVILHSYLKNKTKQWNSYFKTGLGNYQTKTNANTDLIKIKTSKHVLKKQNKINKAFIKKINCTSHYYLFRDYDVNYTSWYNFFLFFQKLLLYKINVKPKQKNFLNINKQYSSSYLLMIFKKFFEYSLNQQITLFVNFELFERLKLNDYVFLSIIKTRLQRFSYRFSTIFFLNEFIDMVFLSFKLKNFNILIPYINKILKNLVVYQHRLFFNFFFTILSEQFMPLFKFFNITGITLRIKGKIGVGGNLRKRHIFLTLGNCSKTTICTNTHVINTWLNTVTGALGFKLLVFYNN